MNPENQTLPTNQSPSLVSLDYVVAEISNELNDYGPTQKSRLLALCISALRDFRLYDIGLIQIAYIKINEAGIAVLPKDYLDYVQIGHLTHAGNVRDFTLNNKMALNRDTDCGDPTRKINPAMAVQNQNVLNAGAFFISPVWGGNNIVPTFYGQGAGLNTAYYKIDKAAGIIIFNGIVPKDEVVLVYKSTGISPNTVIPYELIEPVKAWCHERRERHDNRVAMNKKQLNLEMLKEERSKLRAFTQNFNLAEYRDVMFQNKKQSPRP